MSSKFLKLNGSDFVKGLVIAVFGAVFVALAQAFNLPGFDYATFDWTLVGQVAISAALSYLGKNLLTDRNGSFMGVL